MKHTIRHISSLTNITRHFSPAQLDVVPEVRRLVRGPARFKYDMTRPMTANERLVTVWRGSTSELRDVTALTRQPKSATQPATRDWNQRAVRHGMITNYARRTRSMRQAKPPIMATKLQMSNGIESGSCLTKSIENSR